MGDVEEVVDPFTDDVDGAFHLIEHWRQYTGHHQAWKKDASRVLRSTATLRAYVDSLEAVEQRAKAAARDGV
jgi:hypothetical protein